MTKPAIELSPVEWEVMHAVWRAERPVSVRDVWNVVYPNGEKAYTTVQTFLNILVDKGVLSSTREANQLRYTPMVSRDMALSGSLNGAAKRMFDGSSAAMVSYLVGSINLSQEEISKLKQILEDREEAS